MRTGNGRQGRTLAALRRRLGRCAECWSPWKVEIEAVARDGDGRETHRETLRYCRRHADIVIGAGLAVADSVSAEFDDGTTVRWSGPAAGGHQEGDG